MKSRNTKSQVSRSKEWRISNLIKDTKNCFIGSRNIQDDSKSLSGFPWPINGNPDNNLDSTCIFTVAQKQIQYFKEDIYIVSYALMDTDKCTIVPVSSRDMRHPFSILTVCKLVQ
jgi:hypothetical protein